jgi:hypothetical protein
MKEQCSPLGRDGLYGKILQIHPLLATVLNCAHFQKRSTGRVYVYEHPVQCHYQTAHQPTVRGLIYVQLGILFTVTASFVQQQQ